jgi:hypothetical protein
MNSVSQFTRHAVLRQWPLVCALLAAAGSAVAGSTGTIPMPRMAQRPAVSPTPEMAAAHSASNETWRGETRADLAVRWHRWFEAIPLAVVPHGDPTGANCGIGQAGPVWFLSGPLGGNFNKACTVPAGKAIFSPVYNVIDDYPCPDPKFQPAQGQSLEAYLKTDIAQYVDPLAYATAMLDNLPLRVHRVKTPLFGFTAAASNVDVDSCITGSPQLAVSDGYYVFIEPLSPGQHILQLRSGASVFGDATDLSITLTVK